MGAMEQTETYIIYKATNKVNGKIYIGQTKKTLHRRASQHRVCALTRNIKTKFYDAIRKYGFDNFLFEEIDTALNWQDASYKEKMYIKLYNSYKEGYNSDFGGNTRYIEKEERERISKKLKGHYVSEETKKKIREARAKQKPIVWTEEQKKRASIKAKEYFLTHPGTNKGKKFSEEHCKNISKSLEGRKLSEEHRKKISEIQKGKTISLETRKKIGDFFRGRVLSEEHKRKISETRKKLGLGNYGRWKNK